MKNTTNFSQKSPKKFCCKLCNYTTCNLKDYNKHLLTPKHENTTKKNNENVVKISYNCECGKVYAYRGSLYNHKKKCKYVYSDDENNSHIDKNSTLINK